MLHYGAVLLLAFVIGCYPTAATRPPIDYNSILSIYDLVSAINANNQKIPTLWASHSFEAVIIDGQGKKHFVNGDGVLLYRSPTDIRLQGSKDLIGPVFDMGANATDYWLSILPEFDTIWYGNFADMKSAALAKNQIPIQPEMILQVLGISPIDPNLNDVPAPTMRFNNDMRAYMLVWSDHLPDRWIAQREVWYDYDTLRPTLVLLFDDRGRVVLRAKLSNHRQVQVPGLEQKDWPWVPGKYSLYFPVNGSKLDLTLSDVLLRRGQGPRSVPNDRSFQRPTIGASHEIQIR